MKLSERVSTMHWMFGPNDDRRDAVRVLADDIEALEQYAKRLEQLVEAERARVAPVAHEHSPIVVDEAKPGTDQTIAVLRMPVDERKVAEAYREKVLAEFRLWASRPSDDRTTEQVVLSVDLP